MFKKFIKGASSVASVEGIGTVAGIFVAFMVLAYIGWSPESTAMRVRSKVGG